MGGINPGGGQMGPDGLRGLGLYACAVAHSIHLGFEVSYSSDPHIGKAQWTHLGTGDWSLNLTAIASEVLMGWATVENVSGAAAAAQGVTFAGVGTITLETFLPFGAPTDNGQVALLVLYVPKGSIV